MVNLSTHPGNHQARQWQPDRPDAAIDAPYDSAVPVCRELSTPAGYVDALYVNALGRLTLAEFKLWRNPQARREVIGQILDYAKEIVSWSYEDLQREVSRALKRPGNVLFDLVRASFPLPHRNRASRSLRGWRNPRHSPG